MAPRTGGTQRVSLRRLTQVGAGADTADSADPVEVTVTLTDGRGTVVRRGEATVTPGGSRPNGPRCPPTVWNAFLQVGASARLDVVSAGG